MDNFNIGQILSTKEFAGVLSNVIPQERLEKLSNKNLHSPLDSSALYGLNIEVSANIWKMFHLLEILLRNAISDQLILMFPNESWWECPQLFHNQEAEHILRATNKATKRKGVASKGDIVANLNFGFWTILLSGSYHQAMWERGLKMAFPTYTGKRRELFRSLERLRKLRNRIAHHEPVLDRNLSYDVGLVFEILNHLGLNLRAFIAVIDEK